MGTKIETLKVGDVLYDVHHEQAGNTTMRREGCWPVFVREVGVDEQGPWALLSWNGNPPRQKTYHTTTYKRWPKEWLSGNPWDYGKPGRSGPYCYLCSGRKNHGGHKNHCKHPKAVSARKKALRESRKASP